MAHLGLIDLLAWDIKSKKANLPAYKLHGGQRPENPRLRLDRDRGRRWTSTSGTSRNASTRVLSPSSFTRGATGRRTQASAVISRKWTGDDATLMFDGSAGWDLVTVAEIRSRARGVWLLLVRGADARVRPRRVRASWQRASISRFWQPRPRTACTGTPRPGSTWRRSTWCAPRAFTKAALPER